MYIRVCAGHGIMWDGVHNKELTRLVEAFWEDAKPVATCSQGAATLLDAQVTAANGDGLKPLVRGQKVRRVGIPLRYKHGTQVPGLGFNWNSSFQQSSSKSVLILHGYFLLIFRLDRVPLAI